MPRFRMVVLVLVAVALSVVALRRSIHGAGRAVPGGVLIGDAAMYDRVSRVVLGGLFRGIAADVAAGAPAHAKVLEIGCGPGLLSIELARAHGLEVTGLDLDPAMIDRARANAGMPSDGTEPAPTFVVGDVAALPFADGSFDVVASTFSMHHWSDRDAGLQRDRPRPAPGRAGAHLGSQAGRPALPSRGRHDVDAGRHGARPGDGHPVAMARPADPGAPSGVHPRLTHGSRRGAHQGRGTFG